MYLTFGSQGIARCVLLLIERVRATGGGDGGRIAAAAAPSSEPSTAPAFGEPDSRSLADCSLAATIVSSSSSALVDRTFVLKPDDEEDESDEAGVGVDAVLRRERKPVFELVLLLRARVLRAAAAAERSPMAMRSPRAAAARAPDPGASSPASSVAEGGGLAERTPRITCA